MQVLNTLWHWFGVAMTVAPFPFLIWDMLRKDDPEGDRARHKQRVREHFERMNNARHHG